MTAFRTRRSQIGRFAALCGAVLLELASAGASARADEAIVFAAASLKTALDAINGQTGGPAGHKPAKISYAASSALARQIEAGAPADLFISADSDWMDYLQQRNLIRADTRADLLANRLVLIAPADSRAEVTIAPGFPLAALLGDGRLAMADTGAVPAGKYGKAALQALGVWDSVRTRIAQAENVRAALALVARGEAPFGIVYRTDAAAEADVRVLGVFPESTHPPIVYPAAIVAGSTKPQAATFLARLRSPAARATFERQGFVLLQPRLDSYGGLRLHSERGPSGPPLASAAARGGSEDPRSKPSCNPL